MTVPNDTWAKQEIQEIFLNVLNYMKMEIQFIKISKQSLEGNVQL